MGHVVSKFHKAIKGTTVSVLLEPRGSIFHYGFLGGVLFKYEQPGGCIQGGALLIWAICKTSIWSNQNQTN